MKKQHLISIGIIIVAAFAYLGYISGRETAPNPPVIDIIQNEPNGPEVQEAAALKGPRVVIGSDTISVDVARTNAEVERGLSGRISLAADHGMLFVFPRADIYSFWMPDMNFNIDIIWINNGKVVDITRNASKVFDPKNPVFYKPKSPARYVLEVNAGYAGLHGITVGEKVSFLDADL